MNNMKFINGLVGLRKKIKADKVISEKDKMKRGIIL